MAEAEAITQNVGQQVEAGQQKISESFLPYFTVTSKSITLYLFHSQICKQISVNEKDGKITAENEYGVSCGNPLVDKWRGNSIPTSSDIAWEKAKKLLEMFNNGRKTIMEPEITFEKEDVTRLYFNREFSSALDRYDELRNKKQDNNGSETAQEEQAAQQPVQQINRAENYHPYFVEKKNKDGDVVEQLEICNFNIVFNRLLNIDNNTKLYDCTINYLKSNAAKEEDEIEDVEIEQMTFHDAKETNAFFAKYSHKIWKDKIYMPTLITEINKDEATQYANKTIEEVQKTQHFGWNDNFTAYLTPTWDFQLEMHEGMPDVDPAGKFSLVEHQTIYHEKYGIDEGGDFGSVKILNEKIATSIKLGFNRSADVQKALEHMKNKLLKLSPVMDRIIPVVFLAPLTSVLRKHGMSYQQYLRGRTGYGKSQTALLLMNFFANVDSDEQLANILRDKPNAIEEIGYYHKDCLFIIDNFKESAIDKKEFPKIKALLQSIADRQGTRRMSESVFGSFHVRGTTIVTGEETLQDASTIRKYDTIRFSERIDKEILEECRKYKGNYSAITAAYIKWLLETFGNGIEEEIETRIENCSQFDFKEVVITLNAVGYGLFLDFMLYHKAISLEDHEKMFQTHIAKLKEEDAAKQKEVAGKTTAQLFKDMVTAMVTSGAAEIRGDSEYNKKGVNTIAEVVNGGTEIIFWEKMYPLVKGYAFRNGVNLPDDFDSVIEGLVVEYGVVNPRHSTRVPGKNNPTKVPTFSRKDLLPYSSFDGYPSMDSMADTIPAYIENALKLTTAPTAKQYNEILIHFIDEYMPESAGKNDMMKNNFSRDIEPLVKMYFRGKYGMNWEKPTA